MRKKSCACLVAVFLCLLFSSCGQSKTAVGQVLGTVCSINLYKDGSDSLYQLVFDRLDEIDSEFNLNNPDSELNKINNAAGVSEVQVGDDLALVLETALYYAQKSDGAFDPTIGPLVRLWGINTPDAKVPSQDEIENALSLVDWKKVQLKKSNAKTTVFLEQPGMILDLGGIAKGFAADQLCSILKEKKVRRALIDLGGNILVWGSKKDGAPWKVGIKNPCDQTLEPPVVLKVRGGMSVVTSGLYERYFEQDGNIYHHILNPKTGYPVQNGILSSTVVSPSSMTADALSTTSFLLGPEEFGKKFDEAVVFIKSDMTVQASPKLEYDLN